MRKLVVAGAAVALASSASTSAHDVGAVYQSRGECERALAQINAEDRAFLVEVGEFGTGGEANRWFHEVFRCQPEGDEWVLVFDPE